MVLHSLNPESRVALYWEVNMKDVRPMEGIGLGIEGWSLIEGDGYIIAEGHGIA